MVYVAKDFSKLIGMHGFSETLLKNHFTLYQGYVTNTNKILEILNQMLKEGKQGTPEYAELKRRFGWEFNGMRLHELYFENLGGTGIINQKSKIASKIAESFDSIENWEKEFRATASMRGIGWTILFLDPISGRLFNSWVDQHDTGHLVGCIPLLVIDVFEHAYITDYGLKRADYIEAFFKNIDWNVVEKRLIIEEKMKNITQELG
jgi:Fe-Mn family superoxide dismutase